MARLRIAVIGAGKLGETLVRGLIAAGRVKPHDVVVTAGHKPRARDVARRLGVQAAASNAEAVRGADVVLLCVKPQQVGRVVQEIASELKRTQLLVSAAASMSTGFIEARIGAGVPVVRATHRATQRARELEG